jgi:hypothetical protein
MNERALYVIAADIERNWPRVSPYARPYLEAMKELSSIRSNYYQDSGDSVVRYFLSNCQGWRGDAARRIKAELRAML